jgi:hypothetical protein
MTVERRAVIVLVGRASDRRDWHDYVDAIAATLAETCSVIDDAWAETIEPAPVASRKAEVPVPVDEYAAAQL